MLRRLPLALANALLAGLLVPAAGFALTRPWQPGLRVDLPAGREPMAVATCELEGDAGTLVVAPGSESNTIAVFVGDHHGGFAPRPALAAGRGPCAIAIADVDRDGHADLAVVNRTDGTLGTYRGDGAGGFVPAGTVAVSPSPCALSAGDFDGDGVADFAVADNSDHSITVVFGDGAGGERARIRLELEGQPLALVTADLNLDARADLVATTGLPGLVHVLLGDGRGGFAPDTTFAAGTSPEGIAVADADGDGIPDVAVTDRPARRALVFPGDGLGSLGPPQSCTTDFGPHGIAIADLDGDSRADLVVTNLDLHTITILQGRSDGRFVHLGEFPMTYVPQAVIVDDFDRDGRADLLIPCSMVNAVAVVFDHPGYDLGFRAPAEYAVSDHFSGYVSGLLADLDGDHRADLAFTKWQDSEIAILHGDGTGAFLPATDMPVDFGPRTIGSADLNGDGVADLVVANGIRVTVWLGGPGGTYTLRGFYPPGAYPPIRFADMNGDGKLDLLASRTLQEEPGGIVRVLFGDGTGAFPTYSQVSVPITSWQDFPDLNGDGVPDIAALYGAGPSIVSVRLADGHGGFGPEILTPTGQQGQGWVMSADVNLDGHADVLVSTGQPDSVVTMLGDGTGHLVRSSVLVAYGTRPGAQAIADLTGDGRPDFISQPSLGPEKLYLAPGDGTGRFMTPWTIPEATFASQVVGVQDLDGDGRNDVVFSRFYGDPGGVDPYTAIVYLSMHPVRLALTAAPGPVGPAPTLELTATATFATPSLGAPQGTVTFFDGTTLLIGTALIGGVARATVPWPLGGPHRLTARYGGADGVLGSTSAPLSLLSSPGDAPRIRSVGDARNDEGGHVLVRFSASRSDVPGSDSAVVAYTVHDAPGGGEPLALVSANGSGAYAVTVPVAGDSSCHGAVATPLIVRARFADGRTTDSAPDSGYAVDDTRPAVPAAIAGAYGSGSVHLHWTPGPSPDIASYRVYRGGTGSFDPSYATLVGEVADTQFVAAGQSGHYYEVTAVDLRCNEGDGILLSPAQTTGVTGPATEFRLALTAVRPNPVVGDRLRVEFELPSAAPATLALFDLAGRRIAQAAVGAMGSGRHVIDLAEGRQIPVGVYVLQLAQGRSTVARRVICLR